MGELSMSLANDTLLAWLRDMILASSSSIEKGSVNARGKSANSHFDATLGRGRSHGNLPVSCAHGMERHVSWHSVRY